MTDRLTTRVRNFLTRRRWPIEQALTDAKLLRLLAKPDPVILEIGAHDGATTNRFLQLFERAVVFAFEPDPRAIKKYRANVVDPRATLFDLAIANEDGTTIFHMSRGENPYFAYDGEWDCSGSIRRPTGHIQAHPWVKFERQTEVAVKRLDTWAAEQAIGDVDFVWADVQGAEGDLIAGGSSTLQRTRYFYSEYSDQELYEGQLTLAELLARLPEFEVVERYPDDVLLKNSRLA